MPKVVKQTSDWDYKVNTRPLYDLTAEQVAVLEENNSAPAFAGAYGNFRKGVDTALGICTDRYETCQNPPLFEKIDQTFEDLGVKNIERKVTVVGNGERVYAHYDLKDDKYNLELKPKDGRKTVGDIMGLRLTVKNSFDRTLRLSVALGFVRLVCTNGMTSLQKEMELTRRHQTGLDVSFLGEGIEQCLGLVDEQATIFNRLAATDIKQEQGSSILGRLVKKQVMASNMKDSIEAIWNDPQYGQDSERSLWNLYNATTQHLTRVVEPKRFELSQKTSTKVLDKLNRMSLSEDTLSQFTLPIEEVSKN